MDTKDTALMLGSIAAGVAAGFSFGGFAAGIIGGFTGIGVLVALYFISGEVDSALRRHYRKV